MTLRSLFLFIHVVSAMGLFGALAIEGALLWRPRRAAGTTEMRDALNGFPQLRILAPASLALTAMSGMYLVRAVWGWHAAWINVALASLVLAALVGVTATGLRVAQLRKAPGGGLGPSSGHQAGYTRDPILVVSFVMRTAIFTGIVFLMTVKPGLEESLAAIGAAAAAGVLASVVAARVTTVETMNRGERHLTGSGWSPEESR